MGKTINYIENFVPEFKLTNSNASKEAIELMKFLSNVQGKGIITGQHCNKSTFPDVEYIKRVTGKTPALIGFDLLSYSFATETPNSTWECIDEIANNRKSVEAALYWAEERNAIITFCWHWFSPTQGRDKSFYTINTDFDLEKALVEGTEENKAMIMDMDHIACILRVFKERNIPILWRPLHEAEGAWFWWGAKGSEAYKKLYRLMYERYTEYHGLNNLIWVWNAPKEEWYPGDDVVDINSMDIYVDAGDRRPLTEEFMRGISITTVKKPMALAENGTIPNLDSLRETSTSWLWFMLWNGFTANEEWNKTKDLIEVYNHPYAVTLESLDRFN